MSVKMPSLNYTDEQEIYLRETFLKTKSLDKTRKKFQKKFPDCTFPDKSMIDNIIKKIGESETTVNNKKKTNKKRHTEYVFVEADLRRGDQVVRVHFCEWFLKSINEGLLNAQFVFYTDESWFHLSGYIQTCNTYSWLSQESQIQLKQSKDDMKVGVWCAISGERIIGPVFYEEALSADEYKTLILDLFLNGLSEEERSNGWFQLESETVHADVNTRNKLGEVFGDRIISTSLWPARSPDLNPCKFYLWKKLTYKIYEIQPDTMDDLKKIIQQEIEKTELSELQQIRENMISRYNLCLEQKGETFHYLL